MAAPLALSTGGRNTSISNLQFSNLPSPTGVLPGHRAMRSVGVSLAALAGVYPGNGEKTDRREKMDVFINFICPLCIVSPAASSDW